MAGYYIGRRGVMDEDSLRRFFISFYDIGDRRDIWDPNHHGTPEERLAASIEGYLNSGLAPHDAYSASENWAAAR